MPNENQPINKKLDWEYLDTRYDKDAGLILFEKRIDRMRNPRNKLTFDRLVLESVDWVNMVALDSERRCVMIRQFRLPGRRFACGSGPRAVGGNRLCIR